jgi:hypothetical protein
MQKLLGKEYPSIVHVVELKRRFGWLISASLPEKKIQLLLSR